MPQAGTELRRWRVGSGAVGGRGRCPRLVWVAPLEQVVAWCELSGWGFGAGGDGAEALFVVWVVGAHETVPVIEVEAEVAAGFFVVLDVVGGGVEEFAEP